MRRGKKTGVFMELVRNEDGITTVVVRDNETKRLMVVSVDNETGNTWSNGDDGRTPEAMARRCHQRMLNLVERGTVRDELVCDT